MPRGKRRTSAEVTVMNLVSNLQSAQRSLIQERNGIDARIQALSAAINAMGAAPASSAPRAPGKRAGAEGHEKSFRKGSLKLFVHRVLSSASGPMPVKDVTAAVTKVGFKSKNKTLAKSVGIALTQMPMVEKVGRGLFKLR